jgi:DNA-binding beta-propeller fold protein YncE
MGSHSHPPAAIEGGRITIAGADFSVDDPLLPSVRVGAVPARIVFASRSRLILTVPSGLEPGTHTIHVDGSGDIGSVRVAGAMATGLHQVDNPVFDRDGNLYVTYSGTRGQQVPVSIFRVHANGTRESFSSGIVNPTSMALDPQGRLYVSSRFEGIVYRVAEDGHVDTFASDLGVACGLAFSPDGTLFVGDRSGTIFTVDPSGRTATLASLPPSVAAFHLAYGPLVKGGIDAALYVTGPTLSPYDALYRIAADGSVTTRYAAFGRPQGLAFDRHGELHVVDALAGMSGLYRIPPEGDPELVLAGPGLVGVAFAPDGGIVVTSNETAYRLA